MKDKKTNLSNNLHGHNAPWMLPIWGLISFVGLNSVLILGSAVGLFVSLLFVSAVFTFLAKNRERMPITIRPDTYEYYQNIRKLDPEFYSFLKYESDYFAKEVAEFEYIEKVRNEAALKPKKRSIDFNHRKRVELAVFN